jgi:hypothetical protein
LLTKATSGTRCRRQPDRLRVRRHLTPAVDDDVIEGQGQRIDRLAASQQADVSERPGHCAEPLQDAERAGHPHLVRHRPDGSVMARAELTSVDVADAVWRNVDSCRGVADLRALGPGDVTVREIPTCRPNGWMGGSPASPESCPGNGSTTSGVPKKVAA